MSNKIRLTIFEKEKILLLEYDNVYIRDLHIIANTIKKISKLNNINYNSITDNSILRRK